MSRILKFRAWNKVTKTWEQVHDLYFFEEEGIREVPDAVYEIMQYTGLTNEQGIEIYEGDIVSANNEQQYDDPVCEHYKGVVFYDETKAMYRIKQPHHTYMPALSNDAIVSIEVFGNVCELEPQP